MKKISIFAAAAAAALMFPLAGAAQQAAPETPRGEVRQRAPRPGARAQLTEAQREAMRTLRDGQRRAAEAARSELRELHARLSTELSAAQIDNGRVNQLRDEIARKQAAMTAARIDQRARIAALLTPEQRQAIGERGMRMAERGVRGARGAQGRMMQRRGQRMPQGGSTRQLRQRIEKLERELEELRKKIG